MTELLTAWNQKKMSLAITVKDMILIEWFVRTYCPNGAEEIAALKRSKHYYDYSAMGEGYWTNSGKETLILFLINCKEAAELSDSLPTGGLDTPKVSGGPVAALDLFLKSDKTDLHDYSNQLVSILQGVLQNLEHMGSDFELQYMECNNFIYKAKRGTINWEALDTFCKELLAIAAVLREEVPSAYADAIKEGSTYKEMYDLCVTYKEHNLLTAEQSGKALQVYQQAVGTSQPAALYKMRNYLKSLKKS